jgi:hypothetical protein
MVYTVTKLRSAFPKDSLKGGLMSQFPDNFTPLLIELLKIIAAGIGGFIGSKLALSQFQKQTKFQTKHQHQLEQVEALKEIHRSCDKIYWGIHFIWKFPDDSPFTSKEYISDLHAQIDKTHLLFLGDQDFRKTLNSIKALIGEDRESLRATNQGYPSEIIERLKAKVESKIKEIESKVY